jgi:hypothetical protein
MADETLYLTRQQMLDLRWKAEIHDQPGSMYLGQRILKYSEWMTGDLHTPGIWRAVCLLADGTRLEIIEKRD